MRSRRVAPPFFLLAGREAVGRWPQPKKKAIFEVMRDLRSLARALAAASVSAACGTSEKGEPPSLDVDLPVPAESTAEPPPRAEPARPSSEVMQPNGPPRGASAEPPPESSARSGFGGRCALSSDCEPGLLCFGSPRDGSLFEAIPGGYCAPRCSEDAECARIAPGSFCRRGEHCTAPCSAGYDSEPDGSPKCSGRSELSCLGGLGGGGCLPSCTNDLTCGSGRECYYGSGTCLLFGSSDVLLQDAPIGAACGDTFTCRGYCLSSGEGTASVCSGACTVGVAGCGGGLSNVCVPLFPEGRRGDSGNCFQACRSSADCSVGAGECVPSGLLSAAGEAQAHCVQQRPPAPTFVSQRLTLEDMQAAALSDDILYVQSFKTGAALSRLFVEAGAVCIEGEVPASPDAGAAGASGPSLASLSFQFGRLDPPSPHDITGTEALNLRLTTDRGLFVYATFVGRPGFECGAFILEPALEEQSYSFTPDDLAPRQIGALPWDPSLLDAVTLRLADGVGPFRLCVSGIAFE